MGPLRLPRSSRPFVGGCAALLFLAAPSGSAQELGVVTGRVVSGIVPGRAQAVPGVTIRFPALALERTTDARGRFTFDAVPAGTHEVRAEVVGCLVESRSVEVRRGASSAVDFDLARPAIDLPPLVVTGDAATPAEAALPFATGRVDAAKSEWRSARTVADLIRGEFPGVRIVQGSGLPGSEVSIQLRGAGSIASDPRPLIVVDGSVAAGGGVDLNPRDVSGIRVLKGAAAAAIYGSRGQAGVIEIVTRRGMAATPPERPRLIVDGALTDRGLADIDPEEIETMQMTTGPAAALLLGEGAVRAGIVRITTRGSRGGAALGRCLAPSPRPE